MWVLPFFSRFLSETPQQEMHRGSPPTLGKLLVLSHLVALCDAKATTTSHAHELSERPPQKWFFASHHKTGTILLDAILEPIKGLFNPKLSYRLY